MFNNNRYNPLRLALVFVASLMLPVIALSITEHNSLHITLTALLLPLGFYLLFAAISSRSGRMIWWGFPFIFLSAFQIVILYLFGNSVIATDMFLNLRTTNPDEASELLINIYPAIIAVCLIYLPLLWSAFRHLRKRVVLPAVARIYMAAAGSLSLIAGIIMLLTAGSSPVRNHILRDETFPANVIYNMGLAISESHKIDNYELSSAGFSHNATRTCNPSTREIYVMYIGEASRAKNWQLYGYERQTNPRLINRNDLVLFRQITTQSNTTHKSVPMMLSSVHTSQHHELYYRTGLPALFNEVGFKTYFISNQCPQEAMIDFLADDADQTIYLDAPRHDQQLVECMSEILKTDHSEKILFVLHSYGSHFSYHQRYPRDAAQFLPDDDVAVRRSNLEMIRNAYDNSILYTDRVLDQVIELLDRQDACSAMFYCADHGEDLFDTPEGRFLHSSPTTTYFQLHVASLAWFSPRYCNLFADKVAAARINTQAPATTYSAFHTMADIASISSTYINPRASLVNADFDYSAPRLYLNDHNRAVRLDEHIGIDKEQRELFDHYNVEL